MLGHNSGEPFAGKSTSQSQITNDLSTIRHATLIHLEESLESRLLLHPYKALESLNAAKALHEKFAAPDANIAIKIALDEVACLLMIGDSRKSQETLDSALQHIQRVVFLDSHLKSYCFALKAVCHFDNGEVSKAYEAYQNSSTQEKEAFLGLSLFPELPGIISLTQAQYQLRVGELDYTTTYLRAIEESKDSKYGNLLSAHIYTDLAFATFQSDHFKGAIEYFEQAASLKIEEHHHCTALEFVIDFGMACAVAEGESIYGGLQLLERSINKISTLYELSKANLYHAMSYLLTWDSSQSEDINLLKLAKEIQVHSRRLHGEDIVLSGEGYLKFARLLADEEKYMEAQEKFSCAEAAFREVPSENPLHLMSAQKGRFETSVVISNGAEAYEAAAAFYKSTSKLPECEYSLKVDGLNCLALAAFMTSRYKMAIAISERASQLMEGRKNEDYQNLMFTRLKASVAADLGCFRSSAGLYRMVLGSAPNTQHHDVQLTAICLAWAELYGQDYNSCRKTLNLIPEDCEEIVSSQVSVISAYLALGAGEAVSDVLDVAIPSIESFSKPYHVKTPERAKVDRWQGDFHSCTDKIEVAISYYKNAEVTLSQLRLISYDRWWVNARLMNLYMYTGDMNRFNTHYHIATRIQDRLERTSEELKLY